MTDEEVMAMDAIRAQYGRPVAYEGALARKEAVTAIRSDAAGAQYQGLDGRDNRLTFEIDKADLGGKPLNQDKIVERDGAIWSVIDIGDRPDVNAWVLAVEEG